MCKCVFMGLKGVSDDACRNMHRKMPYLSTLAGLDALLSSISTCSAPCHCEYFVGVPDCLAKRAFTPRLLIVLKPASSQTSGEQPVDGSAGATAVRMNCCSDMFVASRQGGGRELFVLAEFLSGCWFTGR